MPRKRTIDAFPTRFCQHCGGLIAKQKPGGKWKTPAQYQQQKGCSVECSRALRTKTKKAQAEAKRTGQVKVKLAAIDLFLGRKP